MNLLAVFPNADPDISLWSLVPSAFAVLTATGSNFQALAHKLCLVLDTVRSVSLPRMCAVIPFFGPDTFSGRITASDWRLRRAASKRLELKRRVRGQIFRSLACRLSHCCQFGGREVSVRVLIPHTAPGHLPTEQRK